LGGENTKVKGFEISRRQQWPAFGIKPRADAPKANNGLPQGQRRALVCAPLMPEFDRASGSGRIYDFILFLRNAGWKVTFVSRNVIGPPERYVRLLEEAGVVALPAYGDDIRKLIKHERFDLALLAFWHIGELYAPQLRQLLPQVKVIVDSVDLHFVRNARQRFVQPLDGSAPSLLDASAGDEIIRELNTYASADAVLTVSEKEAALLNSLLGDQANATAAPDCEDLPLSSTPFSARKGMLFVGNFSHLPNVDAIKYLCGDVLPKLPAAILRSNPLSIVGSDVSDEVRTAVAGLPSVSLVGWVPSLIPYFQKAKIALVPLRYGAGTKRKLIQSLMIGTPAVSTSVGTEGLDLRDREEVLVADDARSFADAIVMLLRDEELWQRLASNGRINIMAKHGREVARKKFLNAVETALTTNHKPPQLCSLSVNGLNRDEGQYTAQLERIRVAVDSTVPQGACILVASNGNNELPELGSRCGWPFPQAEDGTFSPQVPANTTTAIMQVEDLHEKGAEYLLVPTAPWLSPEYHEELRQHLPQRYRLIFDQNDTCQIFALNEPLNDYCAPVKQVRRTEESKAASACRLMIAPVEANKVFDLDEIRPEIVSVPQVFTQKRHGPAARTLVIGVYLANRRNTVEDIVARLSESQRHRVDQRWIALGGPPPSAAVEAVTVERVETPIPKFELVNAVLARERLSRYEYVLLVDDDVVLPRSFIDHFIALQRHFGFALAQPARTSRSFIDHPIVEQQLGSVARRTLFVEIGPVVSFHRSIFDLVFPFDLTSAMGWGYENVWSAQVRRRKLSMGIIDAVPVDHSLRPPVTYYRWEEADQGRTELLRKHNAPSTEECFRVLHLFLATEISNGKKNQHSIH